MAATLALAACREEGPDLDQTGYFKSEDRDRVFAYHSPSPIGEADAAKLLDQMMWTQGRVSRAVIYSSAGNPGPGDELTAAGNLQRALEMTVTPPHDDWDWMLMVNPRGERTLKGR